MSTSRTRSRHVPLAWSEPQTWRRAQAAGTSLDRVVKVCLGTHARTTVGWMCVCLCVTKLPHAQVNVLLTDIKDFDAINGATACPAV